MIDRFLPPAIGRPFRRFIASLWLSNLSDGILIAAGPLLVASQTDSPALVAAAVILQRLPWFVFGLFAGIAADRFDRRTLVLTGNATRVVVLALLAITIAGDQVNIAVALVAMFLLGSAETFADVAFESMMPMLVPPDQLGVANARVTFGFAALNHLAGPPLGAMLFAAAMFLPFVVEAVLLALALILVAGLRLPPVEREPAQSAIGELKAGIRWLWKSPPVRTLAITIFVFNITWGATNAIVVLYAIEVLELSDRGFGLFLAMGAVGGVVGSFVYGRLEARFALGAMMQVGLVLETLTHAGFALTRSSAVAFALMFVFGLQASVWGTTARAVRQRAVPDDLQGRVGSVYMFCVQTGLVIGGIAGGLIGSLFSIPAVYWYAFVGSAVLVIAIWRELPRIAHAPGSAETAPV